MIMQETPTFSVHLSCSVKGMKCQRKEPMRGCHMGKFEVNEWKELKCQGGRGSRGRV
jgi:hypothetical protein